MTIDAAAPGTTLRRSALRDALAFAIFYTLGATFSVVVGCLASGWQADDRLRSFLGLVAMASFFAALFSWIAASLAAGRRPPPARFAAMLLALTLSTALATAFLFFLSHFFAPGNDHAPLLSRGFLVELFHSALSVTYLFIVTGLRLFFPVGLLVMVLASYSFAVRREL